MKIKKAKKINKVVFATTASLLVASSVSARGVKSGGTTATNLINGEVVKCSVKGRNKGFLSSSSKSLECAIQDSGGELFDFSVPGNLQEKTMGAAGMRVVIEINKSKLKDAKTNNTVSGIHTIDQGTLEEEVLCGPENPEDIRSKKDPYSQGFRVARAVSVDLKDMNLLAYVGSKDDDKWGKKKSPVFLSGQCANSATAKKLMFTDGAVIFDYVQYKKNGPYFVERAAVLN